MKLQPIQSPNFGYSHYLKNNLRGDRPLAEYLNIKAMARYLEQFVNIKVKGFDGNKYIAMILETVGGLL